MGEVTKFPVQVKDTETKIRVVDERFSGCQHERAIVDPKIAEVECADCGAKLNPIAYLVSLARMERLFENQRVGLAAARKALEERSKCRCTKCGQWTEIRRVSNREIKRITSTSNTGGKP